MRFTSHQDIFRRLDKVANYATLSPDERRQYDYDLKRARDYYAEISYARKEAINEGLAQGRAEGRAEGLRESARKMIKAGLDPNFIHEMTGLSPEEIQSIKSSLTD